ncbi:ABC transporter permease [Halosquirtibacter laminarini]|uniref:ABC transporter permease n=1 Tax=Halosquirtibacter laminarini TaxID=3374600 RepID=A0AC61NET5_9BACT|nr:ABC transporter permease [Prolixibacteraceae bacterium]
MKFFESIGDYCVLMTKVLKKPQKMSMFWSDLLREMDKLGVGSMRIVMVISLFMGGILTLQVSYNLSNPFMPKYLIGLGNRDTLILEFSSTILGLILAGKVGSNIATEIGSMRVSEQIDSLDIMGVNSANYLILPKLIACVLFNPILYVLSVATGIIGGAIVGPVTGVVSMGDYVEGLVHTFNPFYVTFSFIKTLVFGFIIASIPAYYGYNVRGGALEVGKASTDSVVLSSILILCADLVITQLFFK